MGAICSAATKILGDGAKGPDENNDPEFPDGVPSSTNVYMVCIALDYPGTGHELTCTQDGDNMMELWNACGLPESNVKKLYNNDGNKAQVIQAVQEMAGRCQAGDYFIFFYSGHGTDVPDKNGDEDDGKDEALCLVTPEGEIDWGAFMTDDEFAELMTENIHPDVRLICLCDCCHSGTISDFDSADWGAIKAASMSGCADDQTSGDTGHGGIFTHSLLMAVADYAQSGDKAYSVGQLYNKTLDFDDEVFASAQDIKCAVSNALEQPSEMAWPLCPDSYSAPHS
jgi:hypothetical protein